MSDLSFGSFPDLLESNTPSGDLTNFEQSNTTEQNKCAVSDSSSRPLSFAHQILFSPVGKFHIGSSIRH